MDLNGRIMLVTGASSGIGAATAKAAAREKVTLILLAEIRAIWKAWRKISDARRCRSRLSGRFDHCRCRGRGGEENLAEFGTPDIIFNNAGTGRWRPMDETEPEEAVQMMASPYFAAFFVTRAFLPQMQQRNSGYIVNMTSVASRIAWPGATAYIAARWAMRGLNEALRADLTGTNIRTMLVTFAKVATPYWQNNPGSEEHLPQAQSMIRILTPEEAAEAIIRGIQRDKHEVVAPAMLRFVLRSTTYSRA